MERTAREHKTFRPPGAKRPRRSRRSQCTAAAGLRSLRVLVVAIPRNHRFVGVTQILVAALLCGGVWVALPARWWPVDVAGTLLAVVSAAGGVGLLAGRRWGLRVARAVGWVVLAAGCVTVSALALTVAHLWGLYGAVGSGGGLLMGTIAALVLPYLVGLPALWLAWLRGSSPTRREE